jgi:predicted transcriptional regulator
MKNYKLVQLLKEIGLDEKEAAVYMAALGHGPTTILKLSLSAGVKRTSVYNIVDSLKLKGLINVEIQGLKTRYVPAPPTALKSILANRLNILERCMPELTNLYNRSEEQAVIRRYEGLSAIKGLYEELLESINPKDDYLVLTDLTKWESIEPKFFNNFVKRRASKQPKLRFLSVFSEQALKRQRHGQQYGTFLRFLPPGVHIDTNLIITPKHVVFHQLIPPMDAIMLSNNRVINLQMQMFNIIWDQSGMNTA